MANYNVANVNQLQTAINAINAGVGGDIVTLADGTYDLTGVGGSFLHYIEITAPNVTVRSASGNRDSVIIKGDGMAPYNGGIGMIFIVSAPNFALEGVTCQEVGYHCIQIRADVPADNVILRNCVFRNSFEMLVKGSADPVNPNSYNDGGLIENCLFEYTAGIGPNSYIGGIDVHKGRNWIVRNNVFKNIASPNIAIPGYPGSPYVSEHAIHFWRDGYNITIENNLIINCDRGIGLGLGTGDTNNVKGGRITNNMIYHANLSNHVFADVGIGIEFSPNVDIYHNTVFFEHDYPNAIEYRFFGTIGGNIKNNLTNKAIANRENASATLSNNYVTATANMFVDSSTGNLHLASAVSGVVNSGVVIAGLTSDIDGDTRPTGTAPDIGADEYIADSVVVDMVGDPIARYASTFMGSGYGTTTLTYMVAAGLSRYQSALEKYIKFSCNRILYAGGERAWSGFGSRGGAYPIAPAFWPSGTNDGVVWTSVPIPFQNAAQWGLYWEQNYPKWAAKSKTAFNVTPNLYGDFFINFIQPVRAVKSLNDSGRITVLTSDIDAAIAAYSSMISETSGYIKVVASSDWPHRALSWDVPTRLNPIEISYPSITIWNSPSPPPGDISTGSGSILISDVSISVWRSPG